MGDLTWAPAATQAIASACTARVEDAYSTRAFCGACLLAPVCSSWVFMNRATSMRTFASPLGDPQSVGVQDANRMVSRVVLLLAVAWAKGMFVIWEQPKGSLMEQHPRMQDPTVSSYYKLACVAPALSRELHTTQCVIYSKQTMRKNHVTHDMQCKRD